MNIIKMIYMYYLISVLMNKFIVKSGLINIFYKIIIKVLILCKVDIDS